MDYNCHYGPALRLAAATLAGPGEHRVLGHFLPGILTAVCSLSCDECDECDEYIVYSVRIEIYSIKFS